MARVSTSNQDSLNLVKAHLVVRPIIKLRRPRALMGRYRSCPLDGPAVLQICCDPRGPEGVAADSLAEARSLTVPLDHPQHVVGVDAGLGQLAVAVHRPKQRLLLVAPDPGRLQVGEKKLL